MESHCSDIMTLCYLAVLAMLRMEKVTITSIIDFNNEVINKLAGYKEIRVDLIFK